LLNLLSTSWQKYVELLDLPQLSVVHGAVELTLIFDEIQMQQQQQQQQQQHEHFRACGSEIEGSDAARLFERLHIVKCGLDRNI